MASFIFNKGKSGFADATIDPWNRNVGAVDGLGLKDFRVLYVGTGGGAVTTALAAAGVEQAATIGAIPELSTYQFNGTGASGVGYTTRGEILGTGAGGQGVARSVSIDTIAKKAQLIGGPISHSALPAGSGNGTEIRYLILYYTANSATLTNGLPMLCIDLNPTTPYQGQGAAFTLTWASNIIATIG